MAEDEIVVFDGETTNVIGRFDAGSSGLDVLEFVAIKTMKKGTVVRCENGRAVTRGSQNLPPGSYRFDAAPAPPPSPEYTKPATLKEIVEVVEPIKRLVVAAYNNQHWAAASTISAVRQRFRREAFTAYGAMNEEETENWCVATGLWWPAQAAASVPYVRNAHIMGRSTPESDWVDMQLGASRDVLENVVPMMASVEAAFDAQRLCVLPSMDDETGDVRFVIHILDPALKDQLVYQDFTSRFKRNHKEWTHPLSRSQERVGLGEVVAETLTFGQLDMLPLVFRGEQRPAKRCFTYHAFWALGHAKQLPWGTRGLEVTEDHIGWQSPAMEARMGRTAIWAAMLQQQPQQEVGSSSEDDAQVSGEETAAGG